MDSLNGFPYSKLCLFVPFLFPVDNSYYEPVNFKYKSNM